MFIPLTPPFYLAASRRDKDCVWGDKKIIKFGIKSIVFVQHISYKLANCSRLNRILSGLAYRIEQLSTSRTSGVSAEKVEAAGIKPASVGWETPIWQLCCPHSSLISQILVKFQDFFINYFSRGLYVRE